MNQNDIDLSWGTSSLRLFFFGVLMAVMGYWAWVCWPAPYNPMQPTHPVLPLLWPHGLMASCPQVRGLWKELSGKGETSAAVLGLTYLVTVGPSLSRPVREAYNVALQPSPSVWPAAAPRKASPWVEVAWVPLGGHDPNCNPDCNPDYNLNSNPCLSSAAPFQCTPTAPSPSPFPCCSTLHPLNDYSDLPPSWSLSFSISFKAPFNAFRSR